MIDGTNNTNGGNTALAERPLTPPPPQSVPAARQVRVVEDTGALQNLMDTARFEHLQRISVLMANSSLLPDHLVGNKKGPFNIDTIRANCFRIVNQALRWGIDPFAMVDETYVVSGKLGYQGKLVAAVVNTRASLVARLSYRFEGTGENRVVTVSGTFEGESTPRESTLRLGDAKTENQMWRKDPDQKLIYSGVVKWARRYCPEVVLGVLTDDDIERMEQMRLTPPTPISSHTLAQQFNESPGTNAPAPEFPTSGDVKDPEGKPVIIKRIDTVEEANAIIESKSQTSPPQEAPGETAEHDQAETSEPSAGGEGEAQLETIRIKDIDWSKELPQPVGNTKSWIDEAVVTLYPRDKFSSSIQAKKAFHAKDVPSWEAMPLAARQGKYVALLDGSLWS